MISISISDLETKLVPPYKGSGKSITFDDISCTPVMEHQIKIVQVIIVISHIIVHIQNEWYLKGLWNGIVVELSS